MLAVLTWSWPHGAARRGAARAGAGRGRAENAERVLGRRVACGGVGSARSLPVDGPFACELWASVEKWSHYLGRR